MRLCVRAVSEAFAKRFDADAPSAYRTLLHEVSPAWAAHLDAGRQLEPVRGFGGQAGYLKRGAGPGWALVGDAGYFKDPITAHGITDALRDAELLARAIIKGHGRGICGLRDAAARLVPTSSRNDRRDRILCVDRRRAAALHQAFSKEMSREVRALAALEEPGRLRESDGRSEDRPLQAASLTR